jgi:hypothetical protein
MDTTSSFYTDPPLITAIKEKQISGQRAYYQNIYFMEAVPE